MTSETTSISVTCVSCKAAVRDNAKFCPECGASQNCETRDSQKDESATASSKTPEISSAALEGPTVRGLKFQTSANPLSSSTTTNHTSNTAEVGELDKKPSKQKKLFMIYGIAAVVVLTFIGAWYLRATQLQKATDNYKFGVAYENGQGVQKDDAQAVFWYQKAADQGNAAAQNKLGEMYVVARGGLAKDETQAVSWFRKAAEQKYAEAQKNLGLMYAIGRGVQEDHAEAERWFRKAAEQGNVTAQLELAGMYMEGRGGLAKDAVQAVSWYQKAADQGNADAQYDLGVMYSSGLDGLAKDDARAVTWYQKAADQGSGNAQENLGLMYAEGQGIPKDYAEAARWFRKSAEQGNANAKVNLANVAARQQQEQQEQARIDALMGTPIDFASLYAKANATGMESGKRYQLDASFNPDLTLLSRPGHVGGGVPFLSIDRNFDDNNQLEAVMRMAAAARPLVGVTCRVVVSMGYNKLQIQRAEDCHYQDI